MNLEHYLHQMTILNDGSHYWYCALQVDQGKALGTLFRKGIKKENKKEKNEIEDNKQSIKYPLT